MKSRLHSHLLTGRFQNQALRTFATEVLKQQNTANIEALQQTSDKVDFEIENNSSSFHVPSNTF